MASEDATEAPAPPTGCWDVFWTKHDPDQVFAYSTVKLVSIKDRYLGIFHYLAMFIIFLYIVFWVILYQKAYLKLEPPVGAVRLTLVDPSPLPTSEPSYCAAPTVNGCKYWLSSQASSQSDGRSLFITTDVQITHVSRECNDTSISCRPTYGNTTEYFVGNIEKFTMSLDHSPRSPNLGIKFSTEDIAPGVLQTLPDESKPNEWKDKLTFESLASDSLALTDLLDAAHYNLDAPADQYLNLDVSTPSGWTYRPYTADQKFKPYRQFGGVILLMIYYDNHEHGFVANQNIIYYAYRPIIITGIDDFVEETIWTDFPTEQVKLLRRGIRVVAVLTGNLGKFDFQTLLVQLTSAIALIAVSKTVVDLLAVYVLPRRQHYYKAKYEETADFSDLMRQYKLEKAAAKVNGAMGFATGLVPAPDTEALTEEEKYYLSQAGVTLDQSAAIPPTEAEANSIEMHERGTV
eukprot:TRINITY_DN983_c0_g1_i1.p1 TRINITY_DN983_c0_g1~~TRINITY_DN983_c0_g1_i1.p1  ORF type:complete len:461 (-),score=124.17 TRINITY_DN983_c0_g1_i1:342-1724(-)